MHLVDERTGKGLPCQPMELAQLQAFSGRVTQAIVQLLAKRDMHASEIARELELPEQNVHYHIKKLRKAGIVQTERLHDTRGGIAKTLRLSAPSFGVALQGLAPVALQDSSSSLAPFVENGQWNATIVASSPDPHGPESVRGRDMRFAVDLAMFFGTFLTTPPTDPLELDTGLRDWEQNLVIIGGPVVNKAAARLNADSPAPYNQEEKVFTSTVTGKTYGQENVGVIVTMDSPYAPGKKIILFAGKRVTGTRAAILTFFKDHEAVLQKPLTVVLGLDKDSDGIVDTAEVLE